MASDSPQRQVLLGEESPTREQGTGGGDWRDSPAAETPTPAADASDKTLALRRPTGHSQEPTKQLCGYLHKQSQKGPLKVWKTRWFVFDDNSCCLFYSNHKNEPAQGKIDISAATLTYEVDNLPKHQFEIMSDGKVTSIQASSNEVMIYWLTALQKKRRKFSAKRKKVIMENTSNGLQSVGGSHGGLISGEATPLNEEDEELMDEDSLPMPLDLEDRNAYDANAARKSWIPKLRPPSFVGGGSWSPNFQRKAQTTGTTGQFTIIENSPESPGDVSPDNSLAPQEIPSPPQQQPQQQQPHPQQPPLRSHRISGRNITNRLSLLMNKTRPAKPEGCPNCTKAQETITHLETELAVKEREVKDRDEINEFLRKEIRLGDMREKVNKEFVESSQDKGQSKEKKVDVLLQREQTIQELQKLLETACLARDTATTQLERTHAQLKEANEQVDLLTQTIKAKDHVVVELTNQVFQLENKGQIPTDPQMAMMPQSLEQELAKTKEALEAYKTQNQFLSSEIVELNAIRSDENEALRVSNSKIHELEAKLCKIESKYFILLKESQEPALVGGEPTYKQELVSQMLREALEGEGGEGGGGGEASKQRSNSYDGYGFSQKWVGTEKEHVTSPLEARVRKLDNQARTAQSVLDESNASRKAKWENYMATFGSGGLHRSDELKQLIRRHGIPQEFRSKVWKWIILDTLGDQYKQGKCKELLEENDSKTSLAVNQIELDLLRTLPTNKYYDSPDSQGIHKLRNVLQAFSWYDPNVGYCQGLNRLAAIALLFLEEEDAFWCLVAIVQHLLPQDYYSRTLLGSQTDQRVLKDLLQIRAAKLSQHLSLCEIDFSLITFNWFHTIYVDNLPVETMLRIWDTFLYEGSKVLFRFALAIFRYNEESIMQQMTSIGIFNHLRTMCQNSTDVEKLVRFGFYGEKNLSKKYIEQRRAFYRQQIKAELDHLEAQRSAPTPPRTHRPTRGVGEEEGDQSPDLISFGSKDDVRLTEDEGEGGAPADSASDGEDVPIITL